MTTTQHVTSFFEANLKKYGPQDSKTLAWNSLESQMTRFKVLTEVVSKSNLDGKSILDVGSGLGDLYYYLNKEFKHINYLGCELSAELCHRSKEKYQLIKVICEDFLSYFFDQQYDFVFCSGALNIETPNHLNYVKAIIKKMFILCNNGIAFNLPSKLWEGAQTHRNTLEEEDITAAPAAKSVRIAYMDPCEIFMYCRTLTHKVTLRHDYMPHDFTIYLYK